MRGRIVIALALAILVGSCSSNVTPTSIAPPPPGAASSPFVLAMAGSADVESAVVYVSVPPDSIPDGTSATILNTRNGASTTVAIINGGFDPVAIPARTGDTLSVSVQEPGGSAAFVVAVPRPHPPRVVRTDPPPSKRDVPLNSSLAVVFSEPINPASLTDASVQLVLNNNPVNGTLSFTNDAHTTAQFTPAAPLQPNSNYQLDVTLGILGADGIPFDSPVTVPFMTGATSNGPVASLTLNPSAAAIPFLGPMIPLTAVFRDTSGQVVSPLTPLHWSSSAPNVISVPDTSTATTIVVGTTYHVITSPTLVYAFGDTGTAEITVTAGAFTASAKLTVAFSPGTGVVLSGTNSLAAGGTLLLNARLQNPTQLGRSSPTLDVGLAGRPVVWSSTNLGVATVDSTGIVTGIAVGTSTISATFLGMTGTAAVTVVPAPPGVGTFVAVDSLHAVDGESAMAAALPDGSALVTDGAAAEVFDPATRKFNRIANPVDPGAFGGTMTTLQDGRILFVNGSAEIFDPATRTFTATGAPPALLQSEYALNAVTLTSGKVLVLYGQTDWCTIPCNMPHPQIYDPVHGTFTAAGSYATSWDTTSWGFSVYSGTRLASGRVLVNGYPRAETYDPATDSFAFVGGADTFGGEFAPDAAILLSSGQVLFVGSNGRDDGYPSGASLYDPGSGLYSPAGPMLLVRQLGTATTLKNGEIFVAGGEAPSCSSCSWSSTTETEIFDPATGRFTLSATALSPRSRHGAVLLGDGSVLLVGGVISTGMGAPGWSERGTQTAELYIPAATGQARRATVTKRAH